MKALTILSTLIITITSCNCQKKATETALTSQSETREETISTKEETMTTSQTMPVLIYESMTRGYFKKIEIQGSSISIQNAREEKPTVATISKSDREALEKACKEVNPKDLSTFKDPTQARFYDGAPITNLKMKEGDTMYSTSDFDGGTPPVEIEKVVNLILKIAEKAEK
ncbi:MAG: hypothetical protein HC854_14070 [Flavobacterium sp.]|nr:hypothetical protein [Flavobacterium sp.]